MKQQVQHCLDNNVKIIQIDEAIFSPQTMLARSWSHMYTNTKQLDLRYELKTQALVAAISWEQGLESFLIKPFSINSDSFIDFLYQLRDKQQEDDKIALFMDNLSVHKTYIVQKVMRELNMISIFSIPYSPQYNGIESYFFLVKQQYKRLLLQNTLNGQCLNIRKMMIQAIRLVEDEKISNCCLGGIKIVLNQK